MTAEEKGLIGSDFYATHPTVPKADIVADVNLDMSLPFDWAAGHAFVTVNYPIAKTIADAADRPRWVKGDYFGTLYAVPVAR